eukprot:maker-scaffold_14-snap-gene-0.0-mRNA-1 protein AED:0.05 eAED:0.05 QI:65/1/1/1/1/1/2/453/356
MENEKDTTKLEKSIKEASLKAKEMERLTRELCRLKSEISTLNTENDHALKSLTEDQNQNLSALKELHNQNVRICPPFKASSKFMRFMLGDINLRFSFESDRLKLRDEYNSFKLRANIIYCIFPLVVLFFHFYLQYHWTDTHWIHTFYGLWLLYFYLSSALRESILLLNGSNIHKWWLTHHYLAACQAVALLVWPNVPGGHYQSYVPFYMCFGLFNGLVANLLNYYHKKREYANRALGKYRSNMDVTYQETIVTRDVSLQNVFKVYIACVMCVQLWEILIGLSLMKTWFMECGGAYLLGFGGLFSSAKEGKVWQDWQEELQIISSGVLQFSMGLGNMTTTLMTLKKKWRKRIEKKNN